MVGAVHLRSTLELLRQIRRDGYDGALYFDTFPDRADRRHQAEREAGVLHLHSKTALRVAADPTSGSSRVMRRLDPSASVEGASR